MKSATESEIWLNIALDDLNSSRLLYSGKYFRNAYFLFQQSSEKATKGFLLFSGMTNLVEIKETSHDQFRSYRKIAVSQLNDTKLLADLMNTNPSFKDLPFLNRQALTTQFNNINGYIKFIDGLRHQDLVNITSLELNSLFNHLREIEEAKINSKMITTDDVADFFSKIQNWANKFNTDKGANAEINNFLNNTSPVVLQDLIVKYLRLILDISFINITLQTMALLTIKHSSMTRYPSDLINPSKIYRKSLPIVKHQAGFMDFLEKAIKRMQTLSRANS